MLKTPESLQTDLWIPGSWDQFLQLAADPVLEEGRFYFDYGWMRIEMSPIGPLHSRENSIVANLISLFCTLRGIRFVELTNGSFRSEGVQECQPDIAFYLDSGSEAGVTLPPRSNQPINLDEVGAPTLIVEIASTTLSDDLGRKRLLYERLGVREYWVVDVSSSQLIGFEIEAGRSGEIRESSVLPGVDFSLVEEALQRCVKEDDGSIGRWLMQVFGQNA